MIERLNLLAATECQRELLKCCGSRRWAEQMSAARPFSDKRQLTGTAERVWCSLQPADWLEAFRSHPKIGEKKAAAAVSTEAAAWSSAEQAGVVTNDSSISKELQDLNREYEEKFGYIFIICATGKTSE